MNLGSRTIKDARTPAPPVVSTELVGGQARLLPAETEKTVDVRGGRATIEGTWTGNVPCTATFAFEDVATPMTGDCDLDGSVFASDLFPGTWTLSIYDGSGVRAQRTVVLESHESRALGEIAPDGKNTGP